MKILALETSSQACSVALLDGMQQDFSCIERFEIAPRRHTHLILPMIDSVLSEAGYDIKQIDVLAFGRGPGAFTGVRIATGVVQAISYGADLPVAQISSLAAIAQGFFRRQLRSQSSLETQALEASSEPVAKILVANDARMHEVYFGAYELHGTFMTLTGKEQVIKPDQLSIFLQQPDTAIHLDKNWYTLGSGWSEYAEQLHAVSSQCQAVATENEQFDLPHARDIAYLAFKAVANKELVSAELASPVYLRDNVAKKSQGSLQSN